MGRDQKLDGINIKPHKRKSLLPIHAHHLDVPRAGAPEQADIGARSAAGSNSYTYLKHEAADSEVAAQHLNRVGVGEAGDAGQFLHAPKRGVVLGSRSVIWAVASAGSTNDGVGNV